MVTLHGGVTGQRTFAAVMKQGDKAPVLQLQEPASGKQMDVPLTTDGTHKGDPLSDDVVRAVTDYLGDMTDQDLAAAVGETFDFAASTPPLSDGQIDRAVAGVASLFADQTMGGMAGNVVRPLLEQLKARESTTPKQDDAAAALSRRLQADATFGPEERHNLGTSAGHRTDQPGVGGERRMGSGHEAPWPDIFDMPWLLQGLGGRDFGSDESGRAYVEVNVNVGSIQINSGGGHNHGGPNLAPGPREF